MNNPAAIASNQLIALFQSGRFAELEQLTSQLLEQNPQLGFFWKARGVALQMQGKNAIPAFEHACALMPDDAEAHANLGNVLRDGGRLADAQAEYETALTLAPDTPELLLNLGNAMRASGQHQTALMALRHALQIQPHYADALYSLGMTLCDLDQIEVAMEAYRHALIVQPQFAQAHNNLALLLRQSGQFAQAEHSFKTALTIWPDFVDARYNLGNLYIDTQRLDAAIDCYEETLKLIPDHADALNNLGNVFKQIGRLSDASRVYSAAIAIRPDFIAAHYSLSQLKTYHADDPHCALLEHQIAHTESMPMPLRIQFWFTLGKVYEDVHRYDASFSAYQEGNRLQAAQLNWSELAEASLFARTKTVFSSSYFATQATSNLVDATPIFIVGMPRSGSTLIEQILSSYPNVYGAGELSAISEVITRHMPDADYANFPEAILQFSPPQLAQIGKDYLHDIMRRAPQAMRIVDKMPANFFYLGMIHQILPHAKIIHAMRDPMDSCFSCYSRLFENNNQPFSYELETLGRYYLRYTDLMRHWHAVLPSKTILDLRYEEMVTDTEGQARRMLDYLGLPWNPACLEFHRNKRQVKTASLAQVRQPIYQSSLARWQRFAKHLTPLQNLIAQAGKY